MPRCATRSTSARCSSSSQSRPGAITCGAGHEALPAFSWPTAVHNRGETRYLIHINEAAPTTLIIHSTLRQAQEVTMPMALPWQGRRPSLFAHILAWCNDRVGVNALSAHEALGPSPAGDVICDARWPDQAPDLARHSYDAGLLFRRMAALQVDRDELAGDDPLLFRELQGLCTLCRSKERCVLDLAQEGDEPGNQGWRPQCHDAERSRRRAKLRACGAIPADAAFHRLLGKRVIGRG